MQYLSKVEAPITYSIEIYPFADPERTQTIILVNTITAEFDIPSGVTDANDFFYLESFSFQNDIFNPIQSGSARVVQTQYDKIKFFKLVAEGDLLFIKENGNNIFCGYVESLQYDISMAGTNITINFVNFIKQLYRAKVFGLIFENLQPAQGVVMQYFLDDITNNTLIALAKDKSDLFSFKLYQGEGEDPSLVLKKDTQVFLTITSFMSILQAINKVLYPYQRLIYQDSIGNIVIAPLSLYDDLSWTFEKDNNSLYDTEGRAINAIIPYLNFSLKKNAAGVPNYEYATLFTIPTAQGVLAGNQSQKNSAWFCQYTAPISPAFKRVNQLYNSGFFTISDVIIEDIIVDPNKIDSTLNNISELIQSTSTSQAANVTITSVNQTPDSQIPITSQNKVDVSSILFNYAARTMAENILEETQVSITSMRIKQTDVNGDLLPLPINRLVSIDFDDGILPNGSLFCRGYVFSYSASGGALVTLNCTKPLVGGAYWVNGGLVNV
jgi:hypothetical protein